MSQIDFRLGNLTGRLAGMVGASWKGIAYVRKMVIPANPNTVAQQGVRDTFKALVDAGRRINSTILKPGILPKPKKMSQFNKFIQNNQAMIDAGVFDFANMLISDGSLYTPDIADSEADIANDLLQMEWSMSLQGEALATDPVLLVAYNVERDTWAFETTKTRADSPASFSIPVETGQTIHSWMFFTQGDSLASVTKYALATLV